MQAILQTLVLISFLSANCLAASSFFMNEEQSAMIIDLLKNKSSKTQKHADNNSLRLSGILYMDDEHWTIWINDKQYSTAGQNDLFSIDAVTENSVTITLPDGSSTTLFISDDPIDMKDENEKSEEKKEIGTEQTIN